MSSEASAAEEEKAPLIEEPRSEGSGEGGEEGSSTTEVPFGAEPPPSTADVIHVADGVLKQIVRPALETATSPPEGATCFVHYRAWTEGSTRSKIFDTWEENSPLQLVLGREKKELKGLVVGVASMREGERCLMHVIADLAYGKEGSFSFPHVPPSCDILYEVLLIGYDRTKAGVRGRSQMTVEERIAAADERRAEGNGFFKAEQFEEAARHYDMALTYFGEDFMMQMFGKYIDMANAVRLPCLLNLAACMLKMDRYQEAIAHCNTVLHEDEKNAKAMFRRACARLELGQTEVAEEDLQKAKKLAPGDKAILKKLQEVKKSKEESFEKQKELYKGMFTPPPPPPPLPSPVPRPWYKLIWSWLWAILRRLWPSKPKKE